MATLMERLTRLVEKEEARQTPPTLAPGDMTISEAYTALIAHGKRFHIDFSIQSPDLSESPHLSFTVWTWENDKAKSHGNGMSLRSGVESAILHWESKEAEAPEVVPTDPLTHADEVLHSIRPESL